MHSQAFALPPIAIKVFRMAARTLLPDFGAWRATSCNLPGTLFDDTLGA
jgi:hypothetical protein